jgi:predicted acetyltransferase
VAVFDDQLRPATPETYAAFWRALFDVFAEDPTGPWLEEPAPTAELDRSLGLWDGDRVVATGGIYSLEMTVPGGTVPCAGVTWITVAATHRRQGVLTSIMRRQLTELHEQQREPVAGLWAAEYPIYGHFGYAPATWRGGLTGRTERLAIRKNVELGKGRVTSATEEEYRAAAVGLFDALRREVPGTMARDERWWDRTLRDLKEDRNGYTARRYVLHTEPDGEVTGYAAYRVKSSWTDGSEPDGTLSIEDVRAVTTPAYAALWQFLLSVDLVRNVRYPMAADDDPVRHLLADARALHSSPVDGLWLRLVDVDRALEARRYPAPIDLVLEVRDRFCPWNAGRWHLRGHPSGARCTRTDRDADLVVDVEALAAAYLGGVSLATLTAAGQVEEISPGAVTLAATAFGWPVSPWCAEEF